MKSTFVIGASVLALAAPATALADQPGWTTPQTLSGSTTSGENPQVAVGATGACRRRLGAGRAAGCPDRQRPPLGRRRVERGRSGLGDVSTLGPRPAGRHGWGHDRGRVAVQRPDPGGAATGRWLLDRAAHAVAPGRPSLIPAGGDEPLRGCGGRLAAAPRGPRPCRRRTPVGRRAVVVAADPVRLVRRRRLAAGGTWMLTATRPSSGSGTGPTAAGRQRSSYAGRRGGRWTAPMRLSAAGQPGSGPVVAMDPSGDTLVAWMGRHAGHGAVGGGAPPRSPDLG